MTQTAEQLANSRFRVLDTPAAAPAKCAVCGFAGREPGRKYVDFNLSLEFYGAVYFCTDCLKAAAVQIGMSPEYSVDEINALRRYHEGKVEKLNTLLAGEYLEQFRNLFEQHFSAIHNLIPDNTPSNDEGNAKGPGQRAKTTKQNSGPASIERPIDVSGNSGNGALGFEF